MVHNDKKITSGKQNLPIPLIILALLAVLGLLLFAGVIGIQLFQKDLSGKETARQQSEGSNSEPVSILPDKPDGVTVLQKLPEPTETNTQVTLAPIAQGYEVATGFAMDLGAADSFLELTRRFVELTNANGLENFQRLDPRAVLRETVTGLEARLLVGPFDTEKQASEACSILILPDGGSCSAVIFQGDLISRE